MYQVTLVVTKANGRNIPVLEGFSLSFFFFLCLIIFEHLKKMRQREGSTKKRSETRILSTSNTHTTLVGASGEIDKCFMGRK